ncbi:MAG TPA: hypothetical protein VL651_03875 [Bacteroidia bacterium]|jgi:hypothetical protein|nr:hypothetical protein [Bacteroidia bacterium]
MKRGLKTLIALLLLLAGDISAQDIQSVNYSTTDMNIVPFNMASDATNIFSFTNQMNYYATTYSNYLSENKTDAAVWLKYYKALRYSYEANDLMSKGHTDLDSISVQMKQNVPGTFEQNFVSYWNSDHDQQFYPELLKAYGQKNSDPELLRQMIGAQMIRGDLKSAAKYCAEWKATGDMPQSIIDYAYDVLQSCAENSVLITNGDYDSYPLVYWQEKMKVRMDVKILDLHLLERADNRAAIFKHFSLALPGNDSTTVFNPDYFRRVATVNNGTKFYLASTLPNSFLTSLSGDLYLCGLASRYGTDEVNNLEFLQNNVGTKMNFTIITSTYDGSKNNFDLNNSRSLSLNYVLPLAMAAERYEAEGNKKRAGELRDMARAIGTSTGKSNEVEQVLSSHS